jgi:hypothetical protein
MTVEGVTRDCREIGWAWRTAGWMAIRSARGRNRANSFMAGHDAIDGRKVQSWKIEDWVIGKKLLTQRKQRKARKGAE